MINWGIRERVLFLALAPVVVVALMLAIHFTNSRITDLDQSLHERGLAIARQLAPASEYGVFSGNREVLQGLADAAKQEADVKAVSIVDASNNTLVASGQLSQALLATSLSHHAGDVVEGENSVLFSTSIYQSEIKLDDFSLSNVQEKSKAIGSGHRLLGRVNVELSRAKTIERKSQLLLNSLLITLLGLVASTLLALRMSRQVTDPISKLAEAVGKISRGNLDVSVEIHSRGEMATLERGFNAMATTIKSAHEDMQEKILAATAKLVYQASHDMLTGLANRREFEVRLGQALLSAKQNGRVHALCYMDLDQFKIVNDTCGHGAGDELLRRLTVLLQHCVRDRDMLARLGGDEFGVLLENCPLDKAHEVAELMRQTVQDFRFIWEDKAFVVGASIGLVSINQESESVAEILSAADAACYAAKDKGRNRVHVYMLEDVELVRRQGEMQWVSRITHALEEDRLRLFYQRIVPIDQARSGEAHFEILLRMLDESGALILPMAFIPAAERYLLMPTIDRWVIRNAFKFCQKTLEKHPASALSTCTINLSGPSLCDEHFLEFVQEQFKLHRIPSEAICFEITETAAITNLGDAIALMKELKKLGCRFSLDDFGSGLSSFTYLKNLPVDYLKIDGAFVKDMSHDPIDFAMVEAINKIGHVMGLQTIAEFVESETILQRLKEIGVDYVQGNYIEPPKPVNEM
jgi:diguanylate cyclase (GGDEF)-like protein